MGQKNGLGKLTEDDREYLGYFSSNKRHGYGVMKDVGKGTIKKGCFNSGKLEGFGILRCDHVNYIFKGFFTDGKFNGVGEEVTEQNTYLGEFKSGERSGVGLCKKTDFVRYLGNWKFGIKEGFGMNTSENGDIFEGQYREDMIHGIGKYDHKQERVLYTGEFLNNRRSGFGRLESKSFIYVGDWRDNKRNGLGYQVTISDNTSYFGMFDSDQRSGIGVSITSKLEYQGEFRDDKPHGRALIKVKGKETKAAIFQDGKLVNYIDAASVEDIQRTIESMDFDQHVAKSKVKLDKIENFIGDEKLYVSQKFAQIEKLDHRSFESIETKLIAQIAQLEKWWTALEVKSIEQEQELKVYFD